MQKKYRVVLPISVVRDGKETVYMPGQVAELDDQTATEYSHALQRVEEGE